MIFERRGGGAARLWQLLASLVVLLLVSSARADEERAEPSDTPPPVVLQADGTLERARAIVATAEGLFLAGHYGAALAEYSSAYDVLEGHPRQYWVLHNLAACNERLFRYDIALKLYEEYLRRAPPDEADRAEVAAIMRTLRSLLATLVVDSRAPGDVWVDERRVGTAPGRWLVPAGRHTVEVRAHLHEAERRDVALGAGKVTVLYFAPRRLSTYRGPPRGYFWAALGASGVAAATGATLGVLALDARNEGRAQARLYRDTTDEARQTRNLALAADASFGAALVFAATAAVLYFVTDWAPAAPTRRAQLPLAF